MTDRAETIREGVTLATQVLAALYAGDTEPREWAIASGRGWQLELGYEMLISLALEEVAAEDWMSALDAVSQNALACIGTSSNS